MGRGGGIGGSEGLESRGSGFQGVPCAIYSFCLLKSFPIPISRKYIYTENFSITKGMRKVHLTNHNLVVIVTSVVRRS